MNDDWVSVKVPDDFDGMLVAWTESTEPNVGWCLLCNSPIPTEADFIPETNTHDCDAGRMFEADIAQMQRKPRCPGN